VDSFSGASDQSALGKGALRIVAGKQVNFTMRRLHLWECFFALLVFAVSAGAQSAPQPIPDGFSGHPRVVIISDIGNEPDDQMSFVRLLLYSNELDLEAMIATTSTWQKTATHPETMHSIIEAYRQVRPNLLLHAKGWPTADELDQRIFAGQPAYGMAATGEGKASAGSQALVKAIEHEDPRTRACTSSASIITG
jgi:hypothetical protein